MKINGWKEKGDPLAPTKHQVLTSIDGKYFTILGDSTEPIELLRLHVETQHAIGFKDASVKIIDVGTREVEADFASYTPPERDINEPPTDEWLHCRNRWLDVVAKFLLPPRLYAQKNDPKKAKSIAWWLRRKKIEISVHENGSVRVYRNGDMLAEFSA